MIQLLENLLDTEYAIKLINEEMEANPNEPFKIIWNKYGGAYQFTLNEDNARQFTALKRQIALELRHLLLQQRESLIVQLTETITEASIP